MTTSIKKLNTMYTQNELLGKSTPLWDNSDNEHSVGDACFFLFFLFFVVIHVYMRLTRVALVSQFDRVLYTYRHSKATTKCSDFAANMRCHHIRLINTG